MRENSRGDGRVGANDSIPLLIFATAGENACTGGEAEGLALWETEGEDLGVVAHALLCDKRRGAEVLPEEALTSRYDGSDGWSDVVG